MLMILIPLTMTLCWGGGLLINKGMLSLSNFILLLCLLSMWLVVYSAIVNKSSRGLYALLNVLVYSCVMFSIKTKSLVLFYIFFEFSIIPITLIVFLYGYQPEKLQAASSLLLYTVVSSLPLLLYILNGNMTLFTSSFLTIPITLSFLIKTPMYFFHTWLPKAHVEAPVGGSMVLAGVLLKLGSYGLLLFLPHVKMNLLLSFYFGMSLVGPIISSLICLRQGDLKMLIAYSSVVHMSVVTLGFISGSELGQTCGLMMVMGHGLSSPMLFAFTFFLYEDSHSRLMVNNKNNCPMIVSGLIGLVSLNMGVPPSLSLWAEVLMSISVMEFMSWALPTLLFMFFIGAAYNLYMYTSCAHSKFNMCSNSINMKQLTATWQTVFFGYSSFLCLDMFHLYWVTFP